MMGFVSSLKRLMALFPKLTGLTLGCWRHPLHCHGDVLLKLIREYWKRALGCRFRLVHDGCVPKKFASVVCLTAGGCRREWGLGAAISRALPPRGGRGGAGRFAEPEIARRELLHSEGEHFHSMRRDAWFAVAGYGFVFLLLGGRIKH